MILTNCSKFSIDVKSFGIGALVFKTNIIFTICFFDWSDIDKENQELLLLHNLSIVECICFNLADNILDALEIRPLDCRSFKSIPLHETFDLCQFNFNQLFFLRYSFFTANYKCFENLSSIILVD